MIVAPEEVVVMLFSSAAATLMLTRPRRRTRRPNAMLTEATPATPPPRSCAGGQPSSPAPLFVGVLGPVLVTRDGAPVALTARQTELVALLASYPGGLSEDRVRAALWGDQPAARGSFNNLVSATRRRLGSIDGELLLPVIGEDRRYRLHPKVGCDLRLVDRIDSATDIEQLLGAVRGRPFDAPRGYRWADRDGLSGWAADRITAAAHQLAQDLLAAGEPRRALTAAKQGLLAGSDERLYADRMAAHAALGDRAAVERVLDELLAVFDDDDPREALHPDTFDVYRRCGGRRFTQAAGSG